MMPQPVLTPRIDFNSLPSPKGWKQRQNAGMARMAEREEALEGMRVRQHVRNVSDAQADLSRAIERRDDLQNSLNAKRSLLEVHKTNTRQTGVVHPDMQRLKFAIEDVLPEALAHSETEITAARARLADVERRRDEAFAAHAAKLAGDDVEAEAEAVEVKRGPGRPRKGAA